MIRPITCVTFALACGSGMYLYQTKHQVRLLDSQIEQVVHQTEQVREQIRVLHAEWTLLDQPDRLQTLVGQFLGLQPTKPSQFVTDADLDARLPAPVAPEAAHTPDQPAAAEAVPSPPPPPPVPPQSAAVAEKRPPAGATLALGGPPVRAVEQVSPRLPEAPRETARRPVMLAVARPALRPHPQLAVVRPLLPEHRPPPPKPLPRYAVPRYPASTVAAAATLPRSRGGPVPTYGGSVLGMARAAASPPAPTPMTWINWTR